MININEKAYYHNSFPLNFKERDFEIPIYRIIPFYRLLEIIKNKELFVSQTKLWDDTHENFLAKANFQWANLPISYAGFSDGYYGQCWSLIKETDALWRIYSSDKHGVRIKTSIKKLLGVSLNEQNHKQFSTKIRVIGKVSYLTNAQISKWVQKQNTGFIDEGTLTESLFLKRKEFSHEKEIRLIINKCIDREEESMGIERKFITLNIEPNDLVEEITFDPRITLKEYETYLYVLRNMGFINKISRSKLYDFTPLKITK